MKKITQGGYEFQIGDIITGKHAFGTNKYVITRVTAKFAFAKVNDVFEQKFNIIYKPFGFQPLPKQAYNNTIYTVYSKNKTDEK